MRKCFGSHTWALAARALQTAAVQGILGRLLRLEHDSISNQWAISDFNLGLDRRRKTSSRRLHNPLMMDLTLLQALYTLQYGDLQNLPYGHTVQPMFLDDTHIMQYGITWLTCEVTTKFPVAKDSPRPSPSTISRSQWSTFRLICTTSIDLTSWSKCGKYTG